MTAPDFETWLADRIDAQTISPELRRALHTQFEAENAPPSEVLVQLDADAERWPARVLRVEVGA